MVSSIMSSPDDDLSRKLIAVGASFLCVSMVSVATRFYTRIRVLKWIGIDDWLVLVALVFGSLETGAYIVATRYGLGKHIAFQPPSHLKPFQQSLLVSSASYSASAMFVKLSLLTLYLRLSPSLHFSVMVYITMGVVVSFGIGSIVTIPLQCIPLSLLWGEGQGSCLDIVAFYYANAAINVLTDLVIWALPVRSLWALTLPKRQRVGLVCLLGLGGLACVISVYRIATLKDLLRSNDLSYNVVSPLIWYTIELHIAILAACVPAFKALLRRHVPSWLGISHNSDYAANTFSQSLASRKFSFALTGEALAVHVEEVDMAKKRSRDGESDGMEVDVDNGAVVGGGRGNWEDVEFGPGFEFQEENPETLSGTKS